MRCYVPLRPAAKTGAWSAGLLVTGAAALWGLFRLSHQFERVSVVGASMEPHLQHGDRLVVWRSARMRPGDVVAARDPRDPKRALVKRLRAVDGTGAWLEGDNRAASTDSRHFGPVPAGLLEGRAIYRYAPPARAGRVTRHLDR